MSKLRFSYKMKVSYEFFAEKCYFTIKCFPADDLRQRVINAEYFISPPECYSQGLDSFGNKLLYGCVSRPHNSFIFDIRGEVKMLQCGYTEKAAKYKAGMFLAPYGKCLPGPGLAEYYKSIGALCGKNDYDTTVLIMRRLNSDFSYAPGVTGINTTAEQAWQINAGVCQDYVHIYITLLRMAGIAARYVSGVTIGEGKSHAWAEALCDGRWIPFDPTDGRLVTDGHVKFAHGRDASDCAINRGILWNCGTQTQDVSAFAQKV